MKPVLTIRLIRQSFLIFLLAAVILLPSASGQNPVTGRFEVTNWTMANGLPQSSVNDIVQTPDGFLWLATYSGLVRFDGHAFTVFNRLTTPGLTSDRILQIKPDSKGTLWVSTENGFFRFRDGACEPFFIRQGSQLFSPLMVTEDESGGIWVSANGIPYRFRDTAFVQVVPVKRNPSSLKTGQAVLGHEKAIFRTSGDTLFQIADLTDRLSHNIQDVIEFPKGSGVYFFATSGDGAGLIQNGKVTLFTEKNGLPSVFCKRLEADRHGQLWVICYNGIARWTGTGFEPLPDLPSESEIHYSSLFEDHEGNYWVGTPAHGLYKFKPVLFSTIGSGQGLKNQKMLSLVRLYGGKILFSTNCGGIYEWDGVRAVPSAVNRFLPNLCVWSVFEDSKRRIWFGSRSLYLTSDISKKGTVFEISESETGNEVFSITEDQSGMIWIGSLQGVFRYDGKNLEKFTTSNGLSYNDTRVIFPEADGSVWFGSVSGLSRLADGKITPVPLREKSPSGKTPDEPYIRAIFRDASGSLWLGTYGDGLFRIKGGKISQVTETDGLFDNIVSHLIQDDYGRIWMGSNRGVSWVHLEDLTDFCDGKLARVRNVSYGTGDGMTSSETNGGFQPSALSLPDGRLFFPTVSGVATLDPSEVRIQTVPPPVVIEKILASGRDIRISGPLVLSPDSNSVEIRFTALSFTDPQKVRFWYLLEGFQTGWYDAGASRSAVFQNLPPGDYTFRVRAANHQGLINEAGVSLPLKILPHFWQTWWFRSLLIFIFVTLGPAVYFFRITRLEREKKLHERFLQQMMQSQETERRRIAAELHDGLGQQILIIKNRADLALQSGPVSETMAEHLIEIRDSSVAAIADVRQISQALRPMHLEQFGLTESLNVLCERLQTASPIEWSYYFDQIDGLISKENEINFYRIIQEGVNNILKHSKANQASVMVRVLDGQIQTMVWDDGIGFNPEEKNQSVGMGLSGMAERAKTLTPAALTLISSPGNGTIIKFNIPVQKN